MNQELATQPASGPEAPVAAVAGMRFEYLPDAFGIGKSRPRLSWRVESAAAGWFQAAYEIEAYEPDGRLYDRTGRVESDQSLFVPWPFAPLTSRRQLQLRLRLWGRDGRPTAWSAPVRLEAGLLSPGDWQARFITPAWDEDTDRPQPSPYLRRRFQVEAGLRQARLYITAHGLYEAEINGRPVSDHVMAPGWTSYHHRLRTQTFDVTGLLQEGENIIGAVLGDGWFRGRLSFGGGRRNIYGRHLALLAQLEILYQDGRRVCIATDESWRATTGPILSGDIYDGEVYDARLEKPGWSTPVYADEASWAGVRLLAVDLETLCAPAGPPVRRTEFLPPAAVITSPSGRTLVDFGQNLVGRVRLAVQGEAGQTITLRHAEVLEGGELCTRPLRRAKATDQYILRGGGEEQWEPRFTFHGFRYVEVDGWPGELRPEEICAVVCHSDMERTGWFDCSEALVNRLHENVVWSMRGNFLDIPTDCPQRDERLGWTGDIQVFAPTATYLYDCAGFLASWLADLALEQADAGGIVPWVVPAIMEKPNPPTAAWGDAAVIVPWVLYQQYGDTDILSAQYQSMRAWVESVAAAAGDSLLWDSGFQFGDWLDPTAPPDRPAGGRTRPEIVATAYFAHSARLLGQAAGVLGMADEEERYLGLAARVRAAFNRAYVSPDGRISSDSVTAYALALAFELLPEGEVRRAAGERLAALVAENDYHISTGFVGTPLVCDALCSAGHAEAAFRLLLQRTCPSWLYPVTMGATTIWERWDSLRPDGSVNPGQMTSFNHYALGAVAGWLHRTVAGLAPAAPGWRRLHIRPRPGGRLTSAHTRHATPYGPAEAGWRFAEGQLTVDGVVPPNVTARVTLPGRQEPIEVGPGTYRWSYPYNPRGG